MEWWRIKWILHEWLFYILAILFKKLRLEWLVPMRFLRWLADKAPKYSLFRYYYADNPDPDELEVWYPQMYLDDVLEDDDIEEDPEIEAELEEEYEDFEDEFW